MQQLPTLAYPEVSYWSQIRSAFPESESHPPTTLLLKFFTHYPEYGGLSRRSNQQGSRARAFLQQTIDTRTKSAVYTSTTIINTKVTVFHIKQYEETALYGRNQYSSG